MTGRHARGWQTTTTDLALILFLIVSAASAHPGRSEPPVAASRRSVDEPAPPAAVYRASPDTSLNAWLKFQPRDARQSAIVVVTRASGRSPELVARGLSYLDTIEASGRMGRLQVERGSRPDVTVLLTYDRGGRAGTAFAAR